MGSRHSNPNYGRRSLDSRPFNPEESQRREEVFAERQKDGKRAKRRTQYDDANWRNNETSRLIDRVVVLDGAARKKAAAKGRTATLRPLSRKQARLKAELKLVDAKDLKPRPKRSTS